MNVAKMKMVLAKKARLVREERERSQRDKQVGRIHNTNEIKVARVFIIMSHDLPYRKG